MRLFSLWLFIIIHHLLTVGIHRPCGRGNKMFFICHLTSCEQVISGFYYFVDNSPFRYHVTNHAFLTWMFFLRHYGGQLKTAVEQEAGEKTDRKRKQQSEKEKRIWKCKVFVQYLTIQIVLTSRKISLITVFPQLLIIMAKKDWNFWKWEGKKESNFQESFNWEKAWKIKNENNAFCLPFIVFLHKVHNIRFEKQICILSELTVIKLGPPVSESSTRISKVHDPTDSERKFHKTRIEKLAIHRFWTEITLTEKRQS